MTSITAVPNQKLQTRYITVKLVLNPNTLNTGHTFPGSPNHANNVKVIQANSDQHDVTAEIVVTKASGLESAMATVTLYGLLNKDIQSFSLLNLTGNLYMLENLIEVYAGYTVDSNGFPPLVYSGQIRVAGVDYNNASRPFIIESQMGIINQNTVAPRMNPPGTITLQNLFQSIVDNSPYPLVLIMNGVTGSAEDVVYIGSTIDQLRQATADHGYNFFLDGFTVTIAQAGQPFYNTTFQLNANNGMEGYPTQDMYGIQARMRFNPAIQFGQIVQVTSYLEMANRNLWYLNGIQHTLQNRGAKFESLLKLNNYLYNIPTGSSAISNTTTGGGQ